MMMMMTGAADHLPAVLHPAGLRDVVQKWIPAVIAGVAVHPLPAIVHSVPAAIAQKVVAVQAAAAGQGSVAAPETAADPATTVQEALTVPAVVVQEAPAVLEAAIVLATIAVAPAAAAVQAAEHGAEAAATGPLLREIIVPAAEAAILPPGAEALRVDPWNDDHENFNKEQGPPCSLLT